GVERADGLFARAEPRVQIAADDHARSAHGPKKCREGLGLALASRSIVEMNADDARVADRGHHGDATLIDPWELNGRRMIERQRRHDRVAAIRVTGRPSAAVGHRWDVRG